VVDEILRTERNKLRPERKQAWSILRTKAPFYDRARRKAQVKSFEDMLELAQKVVDYLGPPWEQSTRGRPPFYNKEKMTSVVLTKHFFPYSFETLRAKLKEVRFDCRISPESKRKGRIPSKSQLHWVMMKIPEPYFQEAVRLMDEWAVDSHNALFGTTEVNKFGVDSTEIQCDPLEEALIAGHKRLRRTTDKLNFISRLVTNTISEISSSQHENTKDLRKLLKTRKEADRSIEGMEIIGDRDYDVEYNYRYAVENKVVVTIKPKLFAGKPYKGRYRRKVQANFSSKTYRSRKMVERPVGNMERRDGNKIHYKRPDMKKKGELLRAFAHNTKAYFMQEAWHEIFTRFSLLPKGVGGDEM